MHRYTTAVLDHLSAARTALRNAVDAVPEPLRTRRPAAERWSVAEVLEHLSIVEGLFTQRIVDAIATARQTGLGQERAPERVPLAADVATRVVDRSSKRTAPDRAQPTGSLDPAAAWSAVEKARAHLIQTLTDADGLALSEVMTSHPAFGEMTVYQMSELIAGHETRHTEQIRENAAQLATT